MMIVKRWKPCECEGGSILVKMDDEFGDTEWQRCPRCKGVGEIYFGADNEPEDFVERDQ